MLKDMRYVLLFFNAGVVALMAMHVYVNESGMAAISDRHDITAIAAMFVVALMILYVYKNERTMQQIAPKSDRTGSIMFSAYLSTTIVNPHANQIIIFDKTWTNTNTVYNTGSGIFTAPISGYYMFSLTIASNAVNTHVHLVCNGTAVAYLIADIDHARHFGRGSLTLIHPMNVGDNIWVKSTDNKINIQILGLKPPVTIFTGLLLQKM